MAMKQGACFRFAGFHKGKPMSEFRHTHLNSRRWLSDGIRCSVIVDLPCPPPALAQRHPPFSKRVFPSKNNIFQKKACTTLLERKACWL